MARWHRTPLEFERTREHARGIFFARTRVRSQEGQPDERAAVLSRFAVARTRADASAGPVDALRKAARRVRHTARSVQSIGADERTGDGRLRGVACAVAAAGATRACADRSAVRSAGRVHADYGGAGGAR